MAGLQHFPRKIQKYITYQFRLKWQYDPVIFVTFFKYFRNWIDALKVA